MADTIVHLDPLEARLEGDLRRALDPVMQSQDALPVARYATLEVIPGGLGRPERFRGARRTTVMLALGATVAFALAGSVAAGAALVTGSVSPAVWSNQLARALAPAPDARGGAIPNARVSVPAGGRGGQGNASPKGSSGDPGAADANAAGARVADSTSPEGIPPGQAGTSPGKAGTAPGLAGSSPEASPAPPGHGGTPPGHGGTPPSRGAAPTPAPSPPPQSQRTK